ncbi:sulfurtransferase [Sulfurimonas sp. MAG313]|nr:rhodanese-like domain-containing protein [Sulfurimonas sp. MAG313]MDF1881957.1 sulfurtransferase [Sulfurimonas sp. MAG313]
MKFLLLLLSTLSILMADNGFILVEDLNKQITQTNLVLLDVGSNEDYTKGHIQNAQSTNIGKWRHKVKEYMLMNSANKLQSLMQSYGINDDSKVIIYEHNKKKGLLKSSYIALAMARVGFTNVYILDGGISEWSYNEYKLTQGISKVSQGNFHITSNDSLLVDIDYVKEKIGKVPMVEARSEKFYFGTLNSKGVERLGHIKGAMSNAWKNSFEEDGLLSEKTKLDEIFYAGLELKQDKEVILYCTGGLEASMNWYVLNRVMHFKNLKVYDASLRQWGNLNDTPMVKYKWEVFR